MPAFHKTAIEFLEPTLGKLTARKAVELAAKRQGKAPDELLASDVDWVCDGLRPMLRTLLGAATTQQLLDELRRRASAPRA